MNNPGSFENWITNKRLPQVIRPKTGISTDFERWITGKMPFQVVARHPAATGTIIPIVMYYKRRRI
jgi:hypothetical protein